MILIPFAKAERQRLSHTEHHCGYYPLRNAKSDMFEIGNHFFIDL
jgi:hypothetical protein